MITLGADPEFTFFDKNDRPVPAHRLGFGDKQHKKTHGRTTAHRDGFNLEMNFTAPFTCRAFVVEYMKPSLKQIEYDLPKGIKLRAKAAYEIDLQDLMSDAPEDVRVFGCEPAFDAYTGEATYIDIDAETHPWRYAGGHMHFGTQIEVEKLDSTTSYEYEQTYWKHYNEERQRALEKNKNVLWDPNKYTKLAKIFDWLIGIPLTCIYNGPEQFQRRKYYGKAGEFRPQRYTREYMGFEYRTPPPELFNHLTMVSLFYGVGRYIIQNFGALEKKYKDSWGKEIAKAINEGKDPEKFLDSVPHLYNADTIKRLRGVPNIYRWSLTTTPVEAHTGWSEWARVWGIPVPEGYSENYENGHFLDAITTAA